MGQARKGGHESINWDIAHRDTNEVKTARPLVVKPLDGVLGYINRAPDSYNPGGHPLNYGIGNELGKLGRSNRRAFNDNRWGTFGVIRLSFEISSEWLEEGVDTNSVPDNFQKSQPQDMVISREGPTKGTAYYEYYQPLSDQGRRNANERGYPILDGTLPAPEEAWGQQRGGAPCEIQRRRTSPTEMCHWTLLSLAANKG